MAGQQVPEPAATSLPPPSPRRVSGAGSGQQCLEDHSPDRDERNQPDQRSKARRSYQQSSSLLHSTSSCTFHISSL